MALLAVGAQSPIRVAPCRCSCDGFQPSVPVSRLEYFTVVNYAGRALAGDTVQVGPGERLVVLGTNVSAKNLGSLGRANVIKLPVVDATFAENLLGQGYTQAGVPLVVLDEGTYIFAEYPGFEDPTPRVEHPRALVGYRVNVEQP